MVLSLKEVEIKKQMIEIEEDPNTKLLEWPHHDVFNDPVFSGGYADCNGVVLLNHEFVGLSHYNGGSKSKPPSVYIPSLINKLLVCSKGADLTAVIFGGESSHFKENMRVLKMNKIPVVGKYLDDYYDENLCPDEKTHPIGYKRVIVIPKTNEVLLYSDNAGYFKLN